MNSPWTALALGLVILFIEWIAGTINKTTILALTILVLLGGIFPPFAIMFAAVILLYLMLTKGKTVLSHLNPEPSAPPGTPGLKINPGTGGQ